MFQKIVKPNTEIRNEKYMVGRVVVWVVWLVDSYRLYTQEAHEVLLKSKVLNDTSLVQPLCEVNAEHVTGKMKSGSTLNLKTMIGVQFAPQPLHLCNFTVQVFSCAIE